MDDLYEWLYEWLGEYSLNFLTHGKIYSNKNK